MHVFDSKASLSASLGEFLKTLSSARPVLRLAISGGSLPSLVSKGLESTPGLTGQGWTVFLADERCVRESSPDSNLSLVRDTVQARLPAAVMVPMDEGLIERPGEAAAAYTEELKRVFGPDVGVPVFDLILLGMGPDGVIYFLDVLSIQLMFETTRTHLLPVSKSSSRGHDRPKCLGLLTHGLSETAGVSDQSDAPRSECGAGGRLCCDGGREGTGLERDSGWESWESQVSGRAG